MKPTRLQIVALAAGALLAGAVFFQKKERPKADAMPTVVDFNWHVRPILSDRCYKCHGPDERQRKAGLRLDTEAGLFGELPETPGRFAVVRGKPGESELVRRVFSKDTSEVMPAPESHLVLSDFEKDLLKKWVEQGAPFKKHWAFIPPEKAALPEVSDKGWCRNEVDFFTLKKLDELGQKPSPEAGRAAIARRLAFDLTGLPPADSVLEKFMADGSPDFYEKLVDQLLARPAFGEKWATGWLDLARYSDTHGYQDDLPRTMWPWRDWVIKALNENMSYERFVTWQLAGDLLPDRTKETILATGFCRNHKVSQEGGVIDEEYRCEYVADRTNVFGKALLGLTLECARCHDHKFDPVPTREYYAVSAFFNRVPERGFVDNLKTPKPFMLITSKDVEPGGVLSFLNKNERFLSKTDTIEEMVMEDSTARGGRKAYILERGQYDRRGASVEPSGISAALPFDTSLFEKNRLGLAKWLFSKQNPLTARTAVNRVWQEVFGRGIVATSDNLGSQGAMPSHPELLDWLAVDFMESGWDFKKLVRRIVLSSTYRQSSDATAEQIAADPDNVWLARGPRFRLNYESIRDAALAASGLLIEELGGPSCKPYQPPGIWEAMSTEKSGNAYRGEFSYVVDTAARKAYRRSLYTYHRRTIPPPAAMAFDAASRDVCEVRRARTSTPLQALALLNDPQILECGRALANRILEKEPGGGKVAVGRVFKKILGREPERKELASLSDLFEKELASFQKQPERAEKLLKTGRFPQNPALDPSRSAALMMVASAVFNLDEALVKA